MRTLRRLKAGEAVRVGDVRMTNFGEWEVRVNETILHPKCMVPHFRPICPRCSKNGESEYTDLVDGQCPKCGGDNV